MKSIWNLSKKLANVCGISEIHLFITIHVIGYACLLALAFFLVVAISDIGTKDTLIVGEICTAIMGFVIGLFVSILWMLRNEERVG